jgi:hypothetical protein
MKSFIAMPGVLLLPIVLAVQVFISNSALDVHLHNFYFGQPVANATVKWYALILFCGWLLHAALRLKKWHAQRVAWLHVGISAVCIAGLFLCIASIRPAAMPRRHYNNHLPNATQFRLILPAILASVFMCTQLFFLAYTMFVVARHRTNPAINKTDGHG